MGAFFGRLLTWIRTEYGENGDEQTSGSNEDSCSISSTDSLITSTQISHVLHTRTAKENKDVLIDILPVDLLLRYVLQTV